MELGTANVQTRLRPGSPLSLLPSALWEKMLLLPVAHGSICMASHLTTSLRSPPQVPPVQRFPPFLPLYVRRPVAFLVQPFLPLLFARTFSSYPPFTADPPPTPIFFRYHFSATYGRCHHLCSALLFEKYLSLCPARAWKYRGGTFPSRKGTHLTIILRPPAGSAQPTNSSPPQLSRRPTLRPRGAKIQRNCQSHPFLSLPLLLFLLAPHAPSLWSPNCPVRAPPICRPRMRQGQM